MNTFAAVDLSPSRGRVMTASVGDGRLDLTEAHRFVNRPVRAAGTLHWDILGLYGHVLDGLRAAGPDLLSIGVHSWAVDYGLLDGSGALLGNPVHHLDERTDGVMEQVLAGLGGERLYEVSGARFAPSSTLYQLVAATRELHRAESLLLVPDLLAYWLTGVVGAELTNASTTGLLDIRSREWAFPLMDLLGLPERLFAPLYEPGEAIGNLLPEVADETGLSERLPVTAVASYDTASAMAAVPADTDGDFAYIVCGAQAMVGVELTEPVLSPAAMAAGFGNQPGVDGTIGFGREVMGLRPLHEASRSWDASARDLLAAAADVPAFRSVVDLGSPVFHTPEELPARIAAYCRATGQRIPAGRPEMVRCVLESLALSYRKAVRQAAELSGRGVRTVYLVGEGAGNDLLCRLIADACGIPVVAGPVEAAVLGNVLVQAGAFGVVKDLEEMRGLVAETRTPRRYEPSGNDRAWDRAASRLAS